MNAPKIERCVPTEFNGPDGASLYPKLMSMAADRSSKFATDEPVRSDMMLHFGAFITESSGHLSEYLPYYRKRKDLLEKYTDTGYRGEAYFALRHRLEPWYTRAEIDTLELRLHESERVVLAQVRETVDA